MYFIDRYLNWFRNERSKAKFDYRSPKEYRIEFGLTV